MVKRRFWIQYSLVLLATVGCAALRPIHRPKGKIAVWVAQDMGVYMFDLDRCKMEGIDVGIEEVEIGGMSYNRRRNLLVFDASEHEGIPSIYTYDLSTKEVNLLYEGTSYDDMRYRPAFHPDGKRVFSLNIETGVFEHNIATKQWRKVEITRTEETKFQQISFSKTGKKVALTPHHFDAFLIGRMEDQRIVVEKRILEDFAYVISPRWIGDDEIVFAGHKQGQPNHLWKISLADQSLVQLTRDSVPRGTRDPCVSPDGKWIVFKSGGGPADDEKGRIGLWMMSIDGRALEQLTVERPLFRGHHPEAWIP
jgi:hypothetical protein